MRLLEEANLALQQLKERKNQGINGAQGRAIVRSSRRAQRARI